MTEVDVAVVGAGLAGLNTALRLQAAGLSVRVLEARDEVGGRVRTRVVSGEPCELGAMFFSRRHTRLLRLLREYGLTYEPSGLYGARLHWGITEHQDTGRISALSPRGALQLFRAAARVRTMARRIDPDAPWASPTGAGADRLSFGEWLDDQGMDDAPRRLLALVVGGFASVPVARLSLLHVLCLVAANGGVVSALRSGTALNVAGGAQQLPAAMAGSLREPVRFGSPATGLVQDRSGVEVRSGETVLCRARRAVVAAPLATLTGIAFDPGLPAELHDLHAEVQIGHLTKVGAVAETSGPARRRGVLGDGDLRFALRHRQHLVGYSLTSRDVDHVTGAMAAALGVPDSAVRAHGVDWTAEPFARGSYAAFAPGQLTRFGPLLRRSWRHIHFAGAERSGHPDQMEGALESGQRVAEEVVAELLG